MCNRIIPTEISFEEQYSDDSGVEYAVYYEENKGNPRISLLSQSAETSFGFDKIDWFIERLQRIKEEIKGT